MRVAVTGSSGFLGSHVCTELRGRGMSVIAIDQCLSTSKSDETLLVDVRDVSAMRQALAGCEAVFHCAAIADLDECRQDPRLAIDVNISGTLAVLDAARGEGVQRFMHASSVYVFSRSGSVYRTTKQAAEHLVEDLSSEWGIKSTILRFGSLYGPGADPGNAVLRMVRQAVQNGRIEFWGDGSEIREYIHISDAAALAIDSLDERFVGEYVHITGRERLSTRELLLMLAEMLGGSIDIEFRDEPFEGRYRLTPYAHERPLGSRLTRDTYVDLGLGLLEIIRLVSREYAEEEFQ